MIKQKNIKCKNNIEDVPSYALNHLDGLEKHPFYQKRRSIKIEYKLQQIHFFQAIHDVHNIRFKKKQS